ILFCDLVGSTELAGRLDPEELAAAMASYQRCCAGVVERWGGHLAEFLGDGAVVYFGWPQAHEDDAERAVHAALELTQATAGLSAADGTPLAARVGIATGIVLVGQIRGGALVVREGAVGETPNLAARVQAMAEPGGVAISAQTRHLIGDRFQMASLGQHELKGIARPVEVWQVQGVQARKSRFEARAGDRLTPLVGRTREMAALAARWSECVAGAGRAVLVGGEPGIGKSRLVRAFLDHTRGMLRRHIQLQCSAHHVGTPLQPFIEWLKESCGIALDTAPETRIRRLHAYLEHLDFDPQRELPLLAALLSVPLGAGYPPLNLGPRLQRGRTIQVLMDCIHRLAETCPTVIVVEDLHWADPSTLELLGRLVGGLGEVPALLLATARGEVGAPFDGPAVERLDLGRLETSPLREMVAHLTARPLPAPMVDSILASADGIPLFVEELTRALMDDQGPPLAVPATLHDLLVARLDGLPTGKQVAQVASTLGRTFPLELLRGVLEARDEHELQRDLEQLCASGIFEPCGEPRGEAAYAFRHALVREAAYHSQLKTSRREAHLRVAAALEAGYPAIVEAEPEVLAHHHAEGGQPLPAAEYLLNAGRKAIQTCATREAIAHLSRGLALLAPLPRSPRRDRAELRLQASLGTSYMQARGWGAAEVADAYTAASGLSHAAESAAEEIWILWGIWVYHQVRGRIDDALRAAARIQARADHDGAPDSELLADMISLQVLLYAGRLRESQARCESFARRYDAARHRALADLYSIDLELVCEVHHAIGAWLLGEVRRAEALARRAEALAAQLNHAYSVAWCNTWGSVVDLWLGQTARAAARNREGTRLARENDYAYMAAMGEMIAGW
ncbi:MAG TPA: AAA family ATPase, partial [Vicinamibacteria bacterium]